MHKPAIAAMVVYRSRTGDYSIPAVITATTESINARGVELGRVPALTSDEHVHLVCFTPGDPRRFEGGEPFDAATPAHTMQQIAPRRPLGDRQVADEDDDVDAIVVATPFGGSYAEWDIPFWRSPGGAWPLGEQPPGTWAWPAIV